MERLYKAVEFMDFLQSRIITLGSSDMLSWHEYISMNSFFYIFNSTAPHTGTENKGKIEMGMQKPCLHTKSLVLHFLP